MIWVWRMILMRKRTRSRLQYQVHQLCAMFDGFVSIKSVFSRQKATESSGEDRSCLPRFVVLQKLSPRNNTYVFSKLSASGKLKIKYPRDIKHFRKDSHSDVLWETILPAIYRSLECWSVSVFTTGWENRGVET